MAKAKVKSGSTVAKQNLKRGFSSPAAKIISVIAAFSIVLLGILGVGMLGEKNKGKAGEAKGDAYLVNDTATTGSIPDAQTVAHIEQKMNERSEEALSNGESNLGAFVFESSKAPDLNIKDTFSEADEARKANAVSNTTVEEVFSRLREKSAGYDRVESSGANSSAAVAANRASTSSNDAPRGSANAEMRSRYSQQSTSSSYDAVAVDANGAPLPYGVSAQDFTAITNQLASVGRSTVEYRTLPGGILSQPPALAVASNEKSARSGAQGTGNDNVVRSTSPANSNEENKRLVAQAGSMCAARSESAINTDYPLPVFFELLNCKDLTGVRARGTVQMTAGDFLITFTEFHTTGDHNFKFAGKPEGVSININEGGKSGVATSVDNHWISRLGSAALLSLAKTETEFLSQRGSQTVTTGTSSSVSVDPMSGQEKNNARVAGLLQGSMDVITRDTQYGVDRKATMELPYGHVIGIQFMSNIEVIDGK